MVDMEKAAQAIVNDIGNVTNTLLDLSRKLTGMAEEFSKVVHEMLYRVYLKDGAPYGESLSGFFVWLKEQEDAHG